MNQKERQYILLLRVFLFSAALAWGVSVLGLILPWAIVANELRGLGTKLNESDIMVQYWLKMAAVVYTLVGCFYVPVGIKPFAYRNVPSDWISSSDDRSGSIDPWMDAGSRSDPIVCGCGILLLYRLGILAAYYKLHKLWKQDSIDGKTGE